MMDDNIFEPSSNLTFYTVESDRKRLQDYLQSPNVQHVLLDLSGVKHCDSAGLALLIEAKRLCMRFKKTFTVSGMPEIVQDLAIFCGVNTLL